MIDIQTYPDINIQTFLYTFFSNKLFLLWFENDIDRTNYTTYYLTTVEIKG